MPSAEVAALLEPYATATKVESPKVTDCQLRLLGSVRCVQVMPSAEVAALAELAATATKVEPPKVTEYQSALDGSVRCVHGKPAAAIRLKDEAIIPSIGIRQCLRLL